MFSSMIIKTTLMPVYRLYEFDKRQFKTCVIRVIILLKNTQAINVVLWIGNLDYKFQFTPSKQYLISILNRLFTSQHSTAYTLYAAGLPSSPRSSVQSSRVSAGYYRVLLLCERTARAEFHVPEQREFHECFIIPPSSNGFKWFDCAITQLNHSLFRPSCPGVSASLASVLDCLHCRPVCSLYLRVYQLLAVCERDCVLTFADSTLWIFDKTFIL